MDEIPQALETSPLVRYGFAAVFIAACLYDLKLGIRVAGVFLLGEALYQAILGRVPLTGWSNKTTGYLRGPAATTLIIGTIVLSMVFIAAPAAVVRLLLMLQ